MRKNLPTLMAILVFQVAAIAQTPLRPDFNQHKEQRWVDSVMSKLNTSQKVAQLVVFPAYSNKTVAYEDSLVAHVKEMQYGGTVFFQGRPEKQLELTKKLQGASSIPLMVSVDGEWGLGMRLENTISFPYQMALGAIGDNDLIYEMGKEVARQARRMGIHINYAPVVDVNNNPDNPVINYRSFGENKSKVAEKGTAYMRGMQDNGVVAVAKHFPGHGDTNVDSHEALPVIKHSRERLDDLELYPFKRLIDEGVGGIMVAHLNIPALDNEKGSVSSLSSNVVGGLLHNELGFQGLSMTDALNMKGATNNAGPGEIALKSFLAGNDLLVMPTPPDAAVKRITEEVKRGRIKTSELDRKCRKVLTFKYRLGLNKPVSLTTEGLLDDLNTNQAKLLNRKLIENSLTVLENKDNLLPLKRLDTLNIATVSIGADRQTVFQNTLEKYTQAGHYQLLKNASSKEIEEVEKELSGHNLIIVGLHDTGARPYNTKGYGEEAIGFINGLLQTKKVILVSFRNAYTLNNYSGLSNAAAVVTSYFDNEDTQDLSAQLLFGGIGASGRLPVSINDKYREGEGIDTEGGLRFKYTLPEEVGISEKELVSRVDAIVKEGLDMEAYPGAQVLFAKDGKVFFHKAYGHHTYDKTRPSKHDDLYDYASVTKITGTLPAIMKLHDEGKFELDATLGEYVPEMKGSNKADVDFRHLLAHYGRILPYITYYTSTYKKNGSYKKNTLSQAPSEAFNIQLTDNLYLHKDYKQKIYKAIKKTPLLDKKEYRYSGLVFNLTPRIVEEKAGEDYETYVKKNFYHKLGAYTITYNPLRFFPLERIVPTEKDTFFRNVQIHGVVHDEAAAMHGGVSGNAGLFSNANDLAKIMQMYMNMGTYGGERYIQEHTLRKFTSCQFCEEGNRRGLGFDRTLLENKENGTPAIDAGNNSFGHTGYTGMFTWADPDSGLLMVFCSNRVYPTRTNTKLYTNNIRPRIHQVVYDLLKER